MSIAIGADSVLASRERQTPEIQTPGLTVPLHALDEPGTYICNWNGHLLRIPEAELDASRFAAIRRADSQPWTVTRLSADPHISRFEARALANSLGLSTSF